MRGNSRWHVLVMVGAVGLVACTSRQGETVGAEEARDATAVAASRDDAGTPSAPLREDAGPPGCASCGPRERCVDGRCVCQPLTCASGGRRCGQVGDGCGGVLDCGPCSRCAPDEMDCCGACIPKSEKVCPANVHCPTPAPER